MRQDLKWKAPTRGVRRNFLRVRAIYFWRSAKDERKAQNCAVSVAFFWRSMLVVN